MTLSVRGVVDDSYVQGFLLKNLFGLRFYVNLFLRFKGVVSVTRLNALAHQRLVPMPDRSVSEDTQRT